MRVPAFVSRLMPFCLVAVSAVACSDNTGPTSPAAALCSQERAQECRIDQQGCAMRGGVESCIACGEGEFADRDGSCATLSGTAYSHTFPDNETAAGAELVGMCRSWTLNNDEEIWFNAVELIQNEASHHSNWMFVPEDQFEGADGIWPCKSRNYSQLSAALMGGVVYAQSTQATKEVQKFPDGAAVRIMPRARIISDIHTLNTTKEAVKGNMTIKLYAIDKSEVKTVLTPFHVTYHGLDIPAQSNSRFTGECDLSDAFQANKGLTDMKVYYMLPHTHALGTRMFVEMMGGDKEGVSLVDVLGFNGEARGIQHDPPLDVSGATGLRFGCEFHNPRAENVGWGFDDQEMCEALGFAEMPIAFESTVNEALSDGKEGEIIKFKGSCETASFPWDKGN